MTRLGLEYYHIIPIIIQNIGYVAADSLKRTPLLLILVPSVRGKTW